MPLPSAPATKNDGDSITASLWNANNSLWYTALANYVVFKDVASQVVTKSLTITPDAGVALTATSGGITITAGGLTITAGGATVTAGNVAITAGNLTFGAASAKIIPGATSLLFRDNGDANTNLGITDAGAVTVRAGLTVTAGGLTVTAGNMAVTAGNLTFGAASAKIIPGATSFLIRNTADSATNISITDAGAVTIRSGGTLTSDGQFALGNGSTTGLVQCLGADLQLQAASTGHIQLGEGSQATSADYGFPCLPTCAGAPSATPSSVPAGFVPMRYDSTNNRVYFYNGSWRYATLT